MSHELRKRKKKTAVSPGGAKRWYDPADALLREKSAVTIARTVLSNIESFHPTHADELLSLAVWKFTEANGKYKTRFTTPAARESIVKSDIQHEHVLTRLVLRQAMIEYPDRVETLLRLAVACTVTKEEHRLLNLTLGEFGWGRYRAAGLTVVYRDTGAVAPIDELMYSLFGLGVRNELGPYVVDCD